jgi:hypothetical protein
MADNNLSAPAEPVVTTPPTEDQLVDDLADLLEPPATDQPTESNEDKAAEPEDDPLDLDAEDVAEEEADDPDGPDGAEIKGGRFAPDSAKVKLEDGTTITIAELKRNNLYHAGFTQKTQALAKDKEVFDQERRQVTEYAQSLDQYAQNLKAFAERKFPKDPGPYSGPADDFVGYQEWQKSVEDYREYAQLWHATAAHLKAEEDRKARESNLQTIERQAREVEALLKAMPVFRDPVKGPQARQAIASGLAKHYGFTDEEMAGITDHRFFLVIRDALGYRRIKDKAPQVQQQIATKPVRAGVRKPPQAAEAKGRQLRSEQLRKNPTLENGVAALMDHDL